MIRVLTKRAWVVESREKEVQKELDVAREQLGQIQQKQQSIRQKCEDYEVHFNIKIGQKMCGRSEGHRGIS